MRLLILVLILLLIISYGCGNKAQNISAFTQNSQHTINSIISSKSEILGDTIKSPQYNAAVVGIVKDHHITCTGSLIAKNTILTAAHCVISSQNYEYIKYHTDYYLEKIQPNLKNNFIEENFTKLISNFSSELEIYFGYGIKGAEVLDAKKIIKNVILEKSYLNYLINDYKNKPREKSEETKELGNDYFNANDIALIELSEEIPIAPIPLVENKNSIYNQKIIFQTGYGNNGSFYGMKATTILEISKITSNKIFTKSKNAACSGDSGGPSTIKINNQFFIAGIASTGPKVCDTSNPDDSENMLTIFTNEDFIEIQNSGIKFNK